MINSAAHGLLMSGQSSFVITDNYTIGGISVSSADTPIRRGSLEQQLGLSPQTLDVEIVTGGADGPGGALKSAALGGTLDGAAFVYSRNYDGGGDVLRFTGTVQRVDVSSTSVRIVAATATVDLDSVNLPSHVVLPDEFPEIPPPENYNVR